MDYQLTKIKLEVEKELSCSAHDLEHTERVYKLAIRISEGMNVNYNVLIPAIYLHDIGRAKVDRNENKDIDHAIMGSMMAKEILKELDYEEDVIKEICHCIESHRFRTKTVAKTLEAQILFDADKLDGLGATGIARSYIMVGQYGTSIFSEVDKNSLNHHLIERKNKHAPNIEFEIKYKKLSEQLFTDKAKKIADKRIKIMSDFFRLLEEEITGED